MLRVNSKGTSIVDNILSGRSVVGSGLARWNEGTQVAGGDIQTKLQAHAPVPTDGARHSLLSNPHTFTPPVDIVFLSSLP